MTSAALKNFGSAFRVGQFAGVVAKVELGTVAAKVSLAHVVIGANHTALEDGEEVFSGVGVVEHAAHIFLGAVVHRAVVGELAAYLGVDGAFVGQQGAGAVDVGDDKGANVLGIDIGDMERAGATVTLHQCDNGFLLGRLTGGTVPGFAAHIGFIGLYGALGTTKGASGSRLFHGLADTVAEEPSGLVGYADHAAHLRCAHALL